MLNPGLNPGWGTHNKNYFRSLMCTDASSSPVLSPGNLVGCMQAMDDVAHQAKAHKYSFLMMTAGKDKLVENKAAVTFYSKCGTTAAKKQIK